mgnify:FL=1
MSTRSYICMEVGDNQYKTIYCHSDGYLSNNGALLLKYYSDRKTVERLLERGDLSSLKEKIEPEPGRPHSFDWDKRQKDVCVFYGRDRGDKNIQAEPLTLEELDDPQNRTEYVYIFTREGQWKYFRYGESKKGLRDVQEDLQKELEEETTLTEELRLL